jgi:uncharacterized membrane protein
LDSQPREGTGGIVAGCIESGAGDSSTLPMRASDRSRLYAEIDRERPLYHCLSAYIVFGLASLVTGAVISAVCIFGFGQFDPKWSPSFEYSLTLLFLGVLSVVALPGFLMGTWSMAKFLSRGAPRMAMAAMAGASHGAAAFLFGWLGLFRGLVGLVVADVVFSLCLGAIAVLLSPSHKGAV